MQKYLIFLCTRNCQSPLTKENTELMSKCDPLTAHLFWPLVLSLQYKLIWSIIQHIQLGCILLLSILWAAVLGNHPFVAASGILPVPLSVTGYERRPESFHSGRDAGCLPVPVGVTAAGAGCLRRAWKPETVIPALPLCWNCWLSA